MPTIKILASTIHAAAYTMLRVLRLPLDSSVLRDAMGALLLDGANVPTARTYRMPTGFACTPLAGYKALRLIQPALTKDALLAESITGMMAELAEGLITAEEIHTEASPSTPGAIKPLATGILPPDASRAEVLAMIRDEARAKNLDLSDLAALIVTEDGIEMIDPVNGQTLRTFAPKEDPTLPVVKPRTTTDH